MNFFIVADTSAINIWKYVERGIQGAFNWVISFVDSLVTGIDQVLLYDIPKVLYLDSILTPELVGLVNMWFPLSFAIICFTSYISIAAIIFIVNWILGLIPTVS